MRNMKKFASLALATAMLAGVLAGCGSDGGSTNTTPADNGGSTAATAAPADNGGATTAAGEEGKVLNIYVWNEEYASRMAKHLPGYDAADVENPLKGGKIGDVEVVFHQTPSDNNAYQESLDSAYLKQADAAADDKVDIFLVEADYALKYIDSDFALALSDLGISAADVSDQYEYTQKIVTDSNGNLKGASWQAASAGLIYNREIAKEVLGTDDPAEVQKAVADWDKYVETAAKVAEKGYKMCSVNDTYRVYSNNVSGKWVQDGKIVVDANMDRWIDDSKALADSKAETTDDLWGDDWAKGKDGGVFCYFGPAWFFNFCLDADREGSVANKGGWGFVEGPQSYYWGGTWICAAAGTDNPSLVKDIILTMTTDKAVLKEIAIDESECVNSKSVLADLAGSADGNIALLGGQNPYAELAKGAEGIDLSNISAYDQACNESLQNAMKGYFTGSYKDKDEALQAFYKAVVEKHPELSY